MLEMREWSLSNILLIAVMSPFGVGPEAAAAADAAVEEEEDVDETRGPFRSDTQRRDEMGVAMLLLLSDDLKRLNPSGPLLVDGLDRSSPHLPLVLDQKLSRWRARGLLAHRDGSAATTSSASSRSQA